MKKESIILICSAVLLFATIMIVGTATFDVSNAVGDCNDHWGQQYQELSELCSAKLGDLAPTLNITTWR